jgi:hypothetical protein
VCLISWILSFSQKKTIVINTISIEALLHTTAMFQYKVFLVIWENTMVSQNTLVLETWMYKILQFKKP